MKLFADSIRVALKRTATTAATVAVMAVAGFSTSAQAQDITGAGATFPFPIYAKWAEAYKAATGIGMNYQSIGSGGGIRQIKARTVDFGASDMPLKAEELQADGLVQFPAIIGGVVPVMNLDTIGQRELRLTPQLLADIFMGKITKWNDPQIVAVNQAIASKLPNLDITVIHRADGSGTTFLFTDYLSKVSAEWKEKVGSGTQVKWLPTTAVGGRGNEGVAANVSRVKGSIGYVEYAYAKKNKMDYALLRNRDGNFVAPDDPTFAAAAANANWGATPGFGVVLTDQAGRDAWPITGASFILVHRQPQDPRKVQEVLKFFDWAFKNGSRMALELDYVPMPEAVTRQVAEVWRQQLRDANNQPIWR